MNGPICSLLVCRACCCGRERGRVDPAADRALSLLRELLEDSGAEVVVTRDCLGVCERADVIVVRPGTAGRAAGGRLVWLGYTRSAQSIREIAEWASTGGPGLATPPSTLTLHEFPRPARRRAGRAS